MVIQINKSYTLGYVNLEKFIYGGHRSGDVIIVVSINGTLVEYEYKNKLYYVGTEMLKGCIASYEEPPKKPKKKNAPTGLLLLYQEIWNEREQVSFLSRISLFEFNVSMFAHVLAKAQNKYPKFKKNKENIILLTPHEHHLLDNGTEVQRMLYAKKHFCNWEPIYKLREELKEQYGNRYNDV